MKKYILIGMLCLICSGTSALATEYAKLDVYDVRNGPVTVSTKEINVFVEINNLKEYAAATGQYTSGLQLGAYTLTDLQNNPGTILQTKAGDLNQYLYLNPNIYNFDGKEIYYLGTFSIAPSGTATALSGGVVVSFNISAGYNLQASAVIPFYTEPNCPVSSCAYDK